MTDERLKNQTKGEQQQGSVFKQNPPGWKTQTLGFSSPPPVCSF